MKIKQEYTTNEQEIINQWALSVFQRLQREHPEVLRALLNDKEVKQYDQRGKKRIPQRMAKETP